MKGARKRADADGDLRLAPGEYGQWPRDGNNWYACTPNGHMANLAAHRVTEHGDEDGTITVRPSILVSDQRGELWHGFLGRGVWREC